MLPSWCLLYAPLHWIIPSFQGVRLRVPVSAYYWYAPPIYLRHICAQDPPVLSVTPLARREVLGKVPIVIYSGMSNKVTARYEDKTPVSDKSC